jgi:anti-sigma factor RsiW
MTCEQAKDRLDDYVDGTLREAELHEVELHLASCPACAAEERALRALLARVATLPADVSPERDLWPGIASRIAEARPRPLGTPVFGQRPVGRTFPRAWWTPAAGLAAAAAVVVALGATLARVWPPAAGDGSTGTGMAHEAAWTTDPTLLSAERDYVRATTQLMAALEARRAELPPGTVAAVEKDLTTIDVALRQVKSALRQDPGNAQLSHMLAATHQKKLDVLQRVVKLSTQI